MNQKPSIPKLPAEVTVRDIRWACRMPAASLLAARRRVSPRYASGPSRRLKSLCPLDKCAIFLLSEVPV